MAPEPCPVCNEPGGFHDRDIHSGPRRTPDEDFFEEDEPMEDVLAAWIKADKHLTSPGEGVRAVERILRNHPLKEETVDYS